LGGASTGACKGGGQVPDLRCFGRGGIFVKCEMVHIQRVGRDWETTNRVFEKYADFYGKNVGNQYLGAKICGVLFADVGGAWQQPDFLHRD
tara:strand:- start:58894 stop:59166 length:273 start_codon:yes stop_codon:yes gene_type:complete